MAQMTFKTKIVVLGISSDSGEYASFSKLESLIRSNEIDLIEFVWQSMDNSGEPTLIIREKPKIQISGTFRGIETFNTTITTPIISKGSI